MVDAAISRGQPESQRERNRRLRRDEFLEVALGIVAADGIRGLTMQRVTDEVGCATGLIYNYFPTKGSLVAEVQMQSLQVLAQALMLGQLHLEGLLAEREAPADLAALSRVVVASRFWIAAELTFPREIELSRRLFTEPGIMLGDDEGQDLVPPSVALLDLAGGLLAGAAAAGAVTAGREKERAIILIAGSTGVLLTSALQRWDRELFDGIGLAAELVDDLFAAWGAPPELLSAAIAIAEELGAAGLLVPLPPTA